MMTCEEEAMKYFPRDLIERFGSSDDAVARQAEAEWEAANERSARGDYARR